MMKRTIAKGVLLVSLLDARAALDFSGGTIPDSQNGGLVGVGFSGVVSTIPSGYDIISGLTLTLNISGGYNHDLYAYLAAPNGTLVQLFNQPGSPYTSGSGFNIRLGDLYGAGIQSASQTEGVSLTGDYHALGNFSDFNGGHANGTWTLFFQDLSPGGGATTLDGWSLDITAVPEPVNVALGIFGGIALVGGAVRWSRKAKAETLKTGS